MFFKLFKGLQLFLLFKTANRIYKKLFIVTYPIYIIYNVPKSYRIYRITGLQINY